MRGIGATDYAGWSDCLALSNGHLEVVCTTSVGPRIVHVGPTDGPNLCHLTGDAGREPADGEWCLYGGHRLWHAPEREGRTALADNDPVAVERREGGVTLTQPTEPETGITKELAVDLAPDAPAATVTHRLVNENPWPIEVAPWAITVLEGGGTAVLPISDRGDGRTADRSLALWPYTDLGDDRFGFDSDALFVEGARGDCEATKIGVDGGDGWVAYVTEGRALRKAFRRREDATYPDRGAAAQVYTDGTMLELETLGPLERIAPGEATSHVEEWTVLEDPAFGEDSPAALLERVAP